MGENVKSDRESSSQEHIKSTNKIIHLESNKLESKRNIKNKDEMRFDSNGDEIVFEVKYKLGIKDTIQYIIMFMFGVLLIYAGIKGFVLKQIDIVLVTISMLLGILCVFSSSYRLFYTLKNRFYVTNNGIGFERRHWFRIQKRFFRFGEVGFAINSLPAPLYCDAGINIFIVYPMNIIIKPMLFIYLRDKNYRHYIFCKVLTELYYNDIMEIITFIRKRTKEVLEAKGIKILDTELKEKFKSLNNREI